VDQPGPGVRNPGGGCRRRQPHSRLKQEALSDTIRAIGLLAPRETCPQARAPVFSSVMAIVPPLASSQVVNSTQNPQQIAILHWYAVNTITRFTVGTHPP
jgi:hypothetical protein